MSDEPEEEVRTRVIGIELSGLGEPAAGLVDLSHLEIRAAQPEGRTGAGAVQVEGLAEIALGLIELLVCELVGGETEEARRFGPVVESLLAQPIIFIALGLEPGVTLEEAVALVELAAQLERLAEIRSRTEMPGLDGKGLAKRRLRRFEVVLLPRQLTELEMAFGGQLTGDRQEVATGCRIVTLPSQVLPQQKRRLGEARAQLQRLL